MKLHHLGIATKNIKKTELFVKKTHDLKNSIGPIWDKNLNANLQFLEINNGVSIELVEGPIVRSFVKKNINLYHFCYEVEDINLKVNQFINKGGFMIVKPTPALLFENRLVTFISTPIGIIEFLSK